MRASVPTPCRLVLVGLLVGCTPGGSGDAPPSDSDVASTDEPLVFAPDAALRRLPRAEYTRSVEALLGVAVPDDVGLPEDPDTRGFDDQADGLEVSPLLFEAYEAAAEQVVAKLLRRPGEVLSGLVVTPSDALPAADADSAWTMYGEEWGGHVSVPREGTYRISVTVLMGDVGPSGSTEVSLYVDEVASGTVVTPSVEGTTTLTFDVPLVAGMHVVAVLVDPDSDLADPRWWRLRAPVVDGPTDDGFDPARAGVVTCDLDGDTAACVEAILGRIAPRAFRRPLTDAELDRVLALPRALLEQGESPDDVLGSGLRLLLMHPRFLFHVEPEVEVGVARPLDAWELAARLSATIWASLPDDRLREAAADGSLLEDDTLRAEARRMLVDPKAVALADVFVADWLDLSVLDQVAPDRMIYPSFDDDLRVAMREEVTTLARSLVAEQPIEALLTATTGHVPPRLAQHYGLGMLASEDHVDLAGAGRGGLLGTAAFLTETSHPDRGSPTVRGKFVLDKLLCRPPKPPPPGIPALPAGTSNAEAIAAHASDPVCAACHTEIDPLGVALEHFDGIGAWRDVDAGVAVDAVGTLPDGTRIDGLAGLAKLVVGDAGWAPCVATKLFTWSLGRPPGEDVATVEAIAEVVRGGGALDDAVEALVLSPPFRSRKGAP